MSTPILLQDLRQACSWAVTIATRLDALGSSSPTRMADAVALRASFQMIVAFASDEDLSRPANFGDEVEELIVNVLAVVASCADLGEHLDLSSIVAELAVASPLVALLQDLVESTVLPDTEMEWLSDRMHDRLTPLLRLAARLMDPAKFEFGYVPDDWVQAGASAMTVAARLSRTIARADERAFNDPGWEMPSAAS